MIVLMHHRVLEHASSQDHNAVMTHIISFSSGGETKKAHTKPVLKDLMDALYHEVADKWKEIGVLLEIPKGTLASTAEKCQHDPHKCLLEMLETWLERIHPPASWATIIEAVEFLGEEKLGSELKSKYFLTSSPPSDHS